MNESDLLRLAVLPLVCIGVGIWVGMESDAKDVKDAIIRAWESKPPQNMERVRFERGWKSHAMWGKTLRGALTGALVGSVLCWLGRFHPGVLEAIGSMG